MSVLIATVLARYDAAEEAYKENRAARLVRLPSVVAGVGYPMTVYRPSAVHDAWHVVYEARGGRASRSTWMVPETYVGEG